LFADDTFLGYASQDEDQITYVIIHDLHELGDWSKRRLMSFNPDKAEIMLFRNVENSRNFDFYFDGNYVLVKIGSPVIILAASICNLSNLHELETPQLSQTSHAYSNIDRM
jgi:hypothetical protein